MTTEYQSEKQKYCTHFWQFFGWNPSDAILTESCVFCLLQRERKVLAPKVPK